MCRRLFGRARGRCALSLFAALVAPGAFPAAAVPAQEPEQDTTLVRMTARLLHAETGGVLMGGLIELTGHPRRYVTGVHGTVSFEIPAGHYTLTAHKGGYATVKAGFRAHRAGELTVLMHQLGDIDTSIPGRLLVRVAEFGSGRLIEGAEVVLSGGRGGLTDGRGWVEFTDLDGPAAEVTVERFGYETRTERVTLREGRTTAVEVAMSIDAVVLAPLEVEVRSGFLEAHGVYWRMDHGHAMHVFDSRDLIERGGVPHLVQAFTKIPGLHVVWPLMWGRRQCEIAMYWDGMPWGMAAVPWGLDEVPPEEIELVEVYTGMRTPLRFSRGPGDINDCGAIAVWSKRRADRSR